MTGEDGRGGVAGGEGMGDGVDGGGEGRRGKGGEFFLMDSQC